MNYLAHLYLSFGNEEIMVGNFIADAVKGKQILNFSGKIQEGIRLHRMIDEFTDNHPVVDNSKALVRRNYKKYSGVVIDMFYDHFLAANWADFSDESLQKFTKKSYQTLFKYYFIMPARMKKILPAMAAGNWLASYISIENIGLALMGMSHRTKFETGFENGAYDLRLHYNELLQDFRMFFPELISNSKDYILKITQ
jgi:acyl carrier protein phosphodiesterase